MKSSKKKDRQLKVLKGLVELYLQSGKPIGSQTLQEHGFSELSSATIRNYFSSLEEAGFLIQQHASGGRLPTDAALQLCMEEWREQQPLPFDEELENFFAKETKEVALFLQEAAELVSQRTGMAVFVSAPRFDHDAIIDIKLVELDHLRCLAIILTQFGVVQTELIPLSYPLSAQQLKRLEGYCLWRLSQEGERTVLLEPKEQEWADQLYQELIVRYVGKYAHFRESDLWRTGIAQLLKVTEFSDPALLMGALGLFEAQSELKRLLGLIEKEGGSCCWMGEELQALCPTVPIQGCAVVGISYAINQIPVGAIGCVGAKRTPYQTLLPFLQQFGQRLGQALTRNLYTFKIQYRQAQPHMFLANPFPFLIQEKNHAR